MYHLDCPCLPLGQMTSACSASSSPLWKAIQSEALAHHDSEPMLAESLRTLILEPANLIDSLGRIVGRRLFGAAGDSFVTLLKEAADSHTGLGASIVADLEFIRRQDPATTSYLNPFLHFKGFHAVVAHRVAHWLWQNGRLPTPPCIDSLTPNEPHKQNQLGYFLLATLVNHPRV